MAIQETLLIKIFIGIYTGITGHQYYRMSKLEDKIDANKERLEDGHVSKDTFAAHMNTFEAHMETLQVAFTANTKLSDANTRAIEKLFEGKQDK